MSWKPSGWELSLKWMLGKSKVKGSTEAWLVTTLGMLITRRKQKDREASTLQWWRPTEPSVTQNLGQVLLRARMSSYPHLLSVLFIILIM